MEENVLSRIPQSPPLHAEGPTVLDRVRRIREMIALATRGEFATLEELYREKAVRVDVRFFEMLIAREADFFTRFADTHALGIADVFRFETARGSKGEGEQVQDIDHYLKLYRSATIGVQGEFPMTTFFDHYEIRVVDHGYARKSAKRITDNPTLETAVRLHEEWMDVLRRNPSIGYFQSIERQWRKTGAEIEFVPALLLLLSLGSITYLNGQVRLDLSPFLTYLRLEEQIAGRRAIRKEALELEEKRAIKRALQEAGLLDDAVFTLIRVVTLRDRGEAMAEIRRAVLGGPVSRRLAPIADRIARAQALLTNR